MTRSARVEQEPRRLRLAGGIAIVRNVGATACTIPGGSAFEMRDGSGVGVASSAPTGARFMHHGPFVAPVELAPGAVAASQLRWIAANVFGSLPARSVSATSLALAMPGGGSVSVPLTATVWGRSSQPVAFTADRLTTALPELGPAAVSAPGTYVGEGPDGSTYLEGGTPVRELVLAPPARDRCASRTRQRLLRRAASRARSRSTARARPTRIPRTTAPFASRFTGRSSRSARRAGAASGKAARRPESIVRAEGSSPRRRSRRDYQLSVLRGRRFRRSGRPESRSRAFSPRLLPSEIVAVPVPENGCILRH